MAAAAETETDTAEADADAEPAPPFIGPSRPPPSASPSVSGDGGNPVVPSPSAAASASYSGPGPRGVRLHFNSLGGINISHPGGRVNIVGDLPRRVNVGGVGPGNVNGIGGGGGVSLPLAGPLPMPLPVLPPLEPRPLPNQTSAASGGGGEATEEGDGKSIINLSLFECGICYEYMEHPVGCGSASCPARFCSACLERVWRQEMANRPSQEQRSDPSGVNVTAKCPHCRSSFTKRSVVVDTALMKEIAENTETVTCPFEGCGCEIPIRMLRSHEATCPHMRLRCRYADWGCRWVGRKKDLPHHEQCHCEYRGGLGRLVERFRQNDARLLQQHRAQMAGTGQMISVQSRQINMMRSRNAWNCLDVLQMSYEACLFPGRFEAAKEMWSCLISRHEARCAACNILLMIPSLSLIFHVTFQGFKLLSSMHQALPGSDVWVLADTLLLALMTPLLGALCVGCFFIDSLSTSNWTIFNVRDIIPGQPLLRDLSAISLSMAVFSVQQFCGPHPGIMFWQIAMVLTVFYTSFVSRIIEKIEPSAVEGGRIMTNARAWPVATFGLRYGLLFAICGFAPSINAMVAVRLLRSFDLMSRRVAAEDSECFLPHFGVGTLTFLAGFATTLDYAVDSNVISFFDWAVAFGVLVYVNGLGILAERFGRVLADANYRSGNSAFIHAQQASGTVLPNIKPSAIGGLVFGICSFLLLCIAFA